MTTSNEQRRGLLIVDHGTRSPEVNARLAAFAREVEARLSGWSVAHAHMEFGSPDIPEAARALTEAGATEIHVHPHFLTAGYHVTTSIPEILETVREAHPNVEFHMRAPIGEEAALADLVVAGLTSEDR